MLQCAKIQGVPTDRTVVYHSLVTCVEEAVQRDML